MNWQLGIDTKIPLLAAGLVFLLAPVVMFFFVSAILSYINHGIRRDTVNQFERPDATLRVAMMLLIAGEIGGFAVLHGGFIDAQLL
jgi:hypothetical protein